MSDEYLSTTRLDTQPKGPSFESQIVPAALGAGNQLLFGLPEAALKALGPEKVREIAEYKAQNPGYGVGEVGGTIGSLLIPGGTIARTASLGGKIAPLAKLGEVAGRSAGIKQGLAAAAEQVIPRAGADLLEGKDAGQIAGESALGLGLGGAVGGALNLGGKILKHLPARPLEEIDEMANAQILSPIFGKSLTRAIRQTVGTKKGAAGQIEEIDNIMGGMVKELDTHGVKSTQQAEDLVSENGTAWKKVDKAANDAVAQGKLANLGDLPDDMFSSPDVAYAVTRWGTKADDAIVDIADQIKRTTKDPMSVFAQTRAVLNDEIETGFKATTPEGRIRGQVAQAMKNYFDDAAIKASPDAPDLKALKAVWPYYLAMGKALAREKGVIAPAFTPGSKTFTSFVSSGLLERPQDLGKMVAGSLAGGVMEKVSPMVGNVLGSEVASGIKKMLPRQVKGDILSAPKEIELPPALQRLLGPTGQGTKAGVERVGVIPQTGILDTSSDRDMTASLTGSPVIPTMEPMEIAQQPTQPVMDNGGEFGQAQEAVEKGIARAWLNVDPQGFVEQAQPGARERFEKALKSRIIDPKTGQIDYRKAGKVIFAGQKDKAADFAEAYDAFDRIQKGLPDAVKLVTVGDPEAETNKQAVIDAVVGSLKGADKKQATDRVAGVLGDPLIDPAEKAKRILGLLRAYDNRFAPGGLLESAGITLGGE